MKKTINLKFGNIRYAELPIYYNFEDNKIYQSKDTLSREMMESIQTESKSSAQLLAFSSFGIVLIPLLSTFDVSTKMMSIVGVIITILYMLIILYLGISCFNNVDMYKGIEVYIAENEFQKMRKNVQKYFMISTFVHVLFVFYLILGVWFLFNYIGYMTIFIGYLYSSIEAFLIVYCNPFLYRKFLKNQTYETIFNKEVKQPNSHYNEKNKRQSINMTEIKEYLRELIFVTVVETNPFLRKIYLNTPKYRDYKKSLTDKYNEMEKNNTKEEAISIPFIDPRLDIEKIKKYPYKNQKEAYALLEKAGQSHMTEDEKSVIITKLLAMQEKYKTR